MCRFITFPSKVLKFIIMKIKTCLDTFVLPDLCGVLHPSFFLSEILAFVRSIGPNPDPTLCYPHCPNRVDGKCLLHSGFGNRTFFGRLLSVFASKVSYQHQNAYQQKCIRHKSFIFLYVRKKYPDFLEFFRSIHTHPLKSLF